MLPRLSDPRLIVLAFAGFIPLGTPLLKLPAANNGTPWLDAFFEIPSAFGTVGLSLGPTPGLSEFGKLLVSFVMFAGRVGPIAVIVALLERSKPQRYIYPEEDIAIG